MKSATPGHVERAFDDVAASYDATFENNPVTESIRRVVWSRLNTAFSSGDRVLELNCGTGTDALMLAGRGVHVTATDASPAMIEQVRNKLRTHAASANVHPLVLNVESMGELQGESFNGAFSNFAGLNCTHQLVHVIEELANLITPGSKFVACLLNRVSLWEMLSYGSRLQFSKALRRFDPSGVEARVGDRTIRVKYYSPKEFAEMIGPWFEVEEISGLSILSPPPNSSKFIRKHATITRRLLAFDERVRSTRPFNALGDHFLCVARRKAR